MAQVTPPPDPLGAANGDHLGGEVAVQALVPLVRDPGFQGSQVIESRQDLSVAAIGASGAGMGPPGNSGPPFMSLGTDPPDAVVAAHRHGLRGERQVFGGVPLGSQVRVKRGKVIDPGDHLFPLAHRAAGAPNGAGEDGSLPPMALVTPPPDLSMGPGQNLVGTQNAVGLLIPLGGNLGIPGGEVVHAGQQFAAGADRAAAAADPGFYDGLPAVARFTPPPGLPVGPGGHLVGGEGAVFLSIPLGGYLGIEGGQIVEPGQGLPAGAVGTAGLPGGPVLDGRLPDVALFADPSGLFPAADGDRPGGHGEITHQIPLGQQILPPVFQTVIVKRFLHHIPPFMLRTK